MITTGLLLLSMAFSSCSQNRTYLTDEEKSWNPYKEGQALIFESSNFDKDTILIKEVSFIFPDGLGVVDYNQKLRTLAQHSDPKNENSKWETFILILAAKTQKNLSYVVFDLRVKDTQFIEQRYSFEDLEKLPKRHLLIPYGQLDDVIAIGNKHDYSSVPTAIEIIYWSKSKGYVRFDKYDGTTWKLVEIIESF